MANVYNSGAPVGVKPVSQMGRASEFYSAAGSGGVTAPTTIQQTSTIGYRPSSVLDVPQAIGSSNGQSAHTYADNRTLNLYR